jgi:CRISPR-associated protein Csm3
MSFQLHGRIVLRMNVHAVTGLHIGGAAGKLEIGGVDSPVIRNPITGEPYVPGSSVRGKMRSLTERWTGKEQNFPIGRTRGKEVYIHTCQADKNASEKDDLAQWRAKYQSTFQQCPVCSVFGVTGDEPVPHPTALIVRDARLSLDSVKELKRAQTDLPFTEVKWEATIDRVTSAATPRQIERVPAGAVFEGLEMIYSIYGQSNLTHFPAILQALTLVEEDYLGGLGARGSGKVRFAITEVFARKGTTYEAVPFDLPQVTEDEPLEDKLRAQSVSANQQAIVEWVNGLHLIPGVE